MNFPNRKIVEKIKAEYPTGTRVKLMQMDDEQAPPIGTLGTVIGVDDTASILVNWDNGSGLNVVYGEDKCVKLDPVTTICYGEKQEWQERWQAIDFFATAIMSSEGSEQSRYNKIYFELISGYEVATDEYED